MVNCCGRRERADYHVVGESSPKPNWTARAVVIGAVGLLAVAGAVGGYYGGGALYKHVCTEMIPCEDTKSGQKIVSLCLSLLGAASGALMLPCISCFPCALLYGIKLMPYSSPDTSMSSMLSDEDSSSSSGSDDSV